MSYLPTLKTLGAFRQADFTAFSNRIDAVAAALGAGHEDELDATAEDFEAAGFSQEEAEALVFVLTEDIDGYFPCNSVEGIDRWFSRYMPISIRR